MPRRWVQRFTLTEDPAQGVTGRWYESADASRPSAADGVSPAAAISFSKSPGPPKTYRWSLSLNEGEYSSSNT